MGEIAGGNPGGYRLLYIADGGGKILAEGLCLHVAPGDLAILPSTKTFRIKTRQQSLRCYHTVLFPCGMNGGEIDRLLKAPMPKVAIGLKRRWYFEAMKSRLASPHDFARKAAFYDLVALIYEINTPHPEYAEESVPIENALREIQRRLTEPVLDVAGLAAQAKLTPSYFIRLFKSRLGVPPLRYFIRLKIEALEPLVARTELPFHSLARDFGFSDPFHFSRMFKQVTGLSPSQYRHQHSGLERAS